MWALRHDRPNTRVYMYDRDIIVNRSGLRQSLSDINGHGNSKSFIQRLTVTQQTVLYDKRVDKASAMHAHSITYAHKKFDSTPFNASSLPPHTIPKDPPTSHQNKMNLPCFRTSTMYVYI
ncbi:hypothetical protein PTI98_007537 [Pleurotus ostreatus]|nr:hypothetical protein PTI98_007537 [Pleurotus ostreatus]